MRLVVRLEDTSWDGSVATNNHFELRPSLRTIRLDFSPLISPCYAREIRQLIHIPSPYYVPAFLPTNPAYPPPIPPTPNDRGSLMK